MRICLISREYPPETGWGGIATFTQHLARGLKEIGHEPEIVSLAGENHPSEDRVENDQGIMVHRVGLEAGPAQAVGIKSFAPYSSTVMSATAALWRKFLERHNHKAFDAVDAPELLAEGFFPALTKVAPLTVRLYTPHSKFIAERLHNVRPTFDHLYVAMLERIAMLAADAITSPSEDLADFVAGDLNYEREKIRIVRNPIDASLFCPEGPKALDYPGKSIILFVGRLEERKGPHYLLRALPRIIQSCPAAHAVIIGGDTKTAAGQTSVLAELKDILQSSGMSGHVSFLPRVALDQLPSYYRSADVSVVPSVYDNSPYTCLEAMSCGRAVVGTAAGGTGEYIIDGQSGVIVPPRDPDAIAGSVLALLRDGQKRRELGQNARQRVLEHFDRREIARQTVEIYRLAQENFSRRGNPLYMKDPACALADSMSLLGSYEQTIYNLLYLHSWRFRLKHWFNALKQNPSRLGKKVLTRMR